VQSVVRGVGLPPSPKASEDHRSLGVGGQPDFAKLRLKADPTKK
jgi:hypothetical protein